MQPQVSAADEDVTELASGLVIPAQDSEDQNTGPDQILDWKGDTCGDGRVPGGLLCFCYLR